MTVKVATDSASDIAPEVAQALGIVIVPAYVHFGNEVYRDWIDISPDELYRRMEEFPIHPTTSTPSPGDFTEVYDRLAQETDEIVSIHASKKLSAICDAALQGKEAMERKGCRIEVIDSESVSMGLGLVTIAAAKAAQVGESLQQVVDTARQAIPQINLLATLDTLKYALKGGRLGKAAVLLGTMLKVKPMLTMQEGEIKPSGLARTRAKAVEKLYEFVKNGLHIEDVAVVHSTTPKEAETLAERIRSFMQKGQLYISRLGPALGVHGGPGTLLVAFRKGKEVKGETEVSEKARGRLSLPSLRITRPRVG